MADHIVVSEFSTIPSVLNERVALHPDRVALIHNSQRMTYKELGERIHHFAAAFQDLGIKKGEKVALIYENGFKFPVALLGFYQIGAVPLCVNPTLKASEIRHILADSESVAVVIGDNFTDLDPIATITSIRNDLPDLRHLIVDGKDLRADIQVDNLLAQTNPRKVHVEIHPDDLAVLIYTSGTTGAPKGCMHTHRTQLVPIGSSDWFSRPTFKQMSQIIQRYGFGYITRFFKLIGKTMVFFSSGPPYTATGVFGTVMSVLTGRTFLVKERFNPKEVIQLIEQEKVNVLFMLPSLLAILCRNPEITKHDLSSLLFIFTGAAYVSPALADEVRQKIGAPVMIGYGGTEFGTPTMTNPFYDSEVALRETVGKVGANYKLKIVDENRQELPIGEVGEIAVRSPSIMIGYYKNEEATRQTRDEDGWVFTGDLGKLDEEGYLRIAGRVKDMIIRAGQNIYPAELEDVLISHPKIHRAAVVGVPDDLAGEKVIAFVIPDEGETLEKIDVLNFCRENMAPYKVPAEVRFVDEFPLTPGGKVLKRQLREELVAEMVAI